MAQSHSHNTTDFFILRVFKLRISCVCFVSIYICHPVNQHDFHHWSFMLYISQQCHQFINNLTLSHETLNQTHPISCFQQSSTASGKKQNRLNQMLSKQKMLTSHITSWTRIILNCCTSADFKWVWQRPQSTFNMVDSTGKVRQQFTFLWKCHWKAGLSLAPISSNPLI